jgi:hypothetical protein
MDHDRWLPRAHPKAQGEHRRDCARNGISQGTLAARGKRRQSTYRSRSVVVAEAKTIVSATSSVIARMQKPMNSSGPFQTGVARPVFMVLQMKMAAASSRKLRNDGNQGNVIVRPLGKGGKASAVVQRHGRRDLHTGGNTI